MEWVEASGKSLGEARESALDLLGVAEDDAEFVVLSEPKTGLFGRVRGEARVQARVLPVTPPPKRSRRQRPERKRPGDVNGDAASTDRSSKKIGSPGSNHQGGRQQQRAGLKPEARKATGSDLTERGAFGVTDASRVRATPEARSATSHEGPERTAKQHSGRTPEERNGTVEESLTLSQQGEAAKEFIAGLVRAFGVEAELNVREIDEETVEVAATGGHLGLLVGPRGSTLSAVQDLTRTFVQRQSENRTDRILVDVGGYREKRTAALRRFTEGVVAEVKESGSERALEPMSAADRKVVHDAANEIEGIETRSEGEDPFRHVVIQPAS
ncbi:MAG: RNA-binding cell elongation regulator Jag/EloR [Acidimicrobiales bacterium]